MADTSFYGLSGTSASVQNSIQSQVTAAQTSATNAATSETNAAASAVSTAADAVQTAADRVQTGLDAASATASATSATTQAALATTNGAAQVTLATAQVALATTQANNAATSATNSATSETNAAASEASALSHKNDANTAKTAAQTAQAAAETAYDDFDDRYLGAKSSDPSVDNDGNALLTGALYFNTTASPPVMKVYTGSAWLVTFASSSGGLTAANNLSDVGSASTSRTNLGLGTAAVTDTGTTAGNVVVLDGSARLPAVDGSQLTGLPSGYSGWTVSDGSNSENVASTDTVTFAGAGAASVAYNTSNNTLTVTGTDTTYSAATTSAAGLMSATDKTKLDAVEALADVTDTANVVAALTAGTNITIAGNGTISSTDTDTTYSAATTSAAGLMSASDKTKLDGVAASAIASVAEDSSPQLAGDLDVQSNDILMGSQSVKFGTSKWEIVLDSGDNDLNFKYNGTTVFKLSSAGAVVAADNITGYGTP